MLLSSEPRINARLILWHAYMMRTHINKATSYGFSELARYGISIVHRDTKNESLLENWHFELSWTITHIRGRSAPATAYELFFSTFIYIIWIERNHIQLCRVVLPLLLITSLRMGEIS